MTWNPLVRQGQGKHTARKQELLESVFRESIAISKAGKAWQFPYWHIDLNSGSGWNDKAKPQCEGSPLVFLRTATSAKRRCNVVLCDNDDAAIDALNRNVLSVQSDGCDIRICCEDNGQVLRWASLRIAAEENPRFAVGTVLCDPNGWKPVDVPLDEIRLFAERFPRIDLVFNLNLSLFAMTRACRQRQKKGFTDKPDPEDILRSIPHRNWMVSSPPKGGHGNRFSLAVGRSIASAKYPPGFYPLDSDIGLDIIRAFQRVQDRQQLIPFEDLK